MNTDTMVTVTLPSFHVAWDKDSMLMIHNHACYLVSVVQLPMHKFYK